MKLFNKVIEFFKELSKPSKIRYIYGYSECEKAWIVTYGYSLEECRSNIDKWESIQYEPELGTYINGEWVEGASSLLPDNFKFPVYHYM